MPELDSREPGAVTPTNVCAILALPRPPEARSMEDWYGAFLGGTPFLTRNVMNLQQAGLNGLYIYSGGEACRELQLLLSQDKRVSIDLHWTTDGAELAQAMKGRPVALLNGGALHHKNEIQPALEALTGASPESVASLFPEPESLGEVLHQIAHGEAVQTRLVENADGFFSYLPGDEAARIRQPSDLNLQHERLLKASVLNNDSFMDRRVTRFFSRQLTRLFLKTPLTPNHITLLSLVLGLGSALYFYRGTYESGIVGAGLLLLSAWIDCTDGEIARLKFMESPLGGKLDILCDNLVHFAVFFAIGMGLYRTTGQDIFKLLGAFAVLGSLISFLFLSSALVEEKGQASDPRTSGKKKQNLIDRLANRDFTYFLLLMAMIGRLDVFLCLTAVGANAFAAYLLYTRFLSTLLTEPHAETATSQKNRK